MNQNAMFIILMIDLQEGIAIGPKDKTFFRQLGCNISGQVNRTQGLASILESSSWLSLKRPWRISITGLAM